MHARACVDGLDVGAGGYGERCGYVPKFVRRESFDADRLGGLVKEAHTATETPTGPNAARTPSLAMASVELIVYLVVLLGLGWWRITRETP